MQKQSHRYISLDLLNSDPIVLCRTGRLYNKEFCENLVSIWETLPLFCTTQKWIPDEVICISKVETIHLLHENIEEYLYNLGRQEISSTGHKNYEV